ncbi:type II toxin-antitoxin system RelE family toxin [Erwinia amylovora]|uniref:type II toxin-antitoxin system RelE family toxin n=1 Tax=Erwinia amylovora TaxID=552 RepID=UPI001443EC80|nr:type II toxin-antitoxin system RelE/ParE family toxin [Erwinia amylovora]
MSYELLFDPWALKEWKKLGATVREQFKKKLAEVLVNLQVESARLREHPDCCKIKLKSSGYRLVYQVQDEQLVMLAISV